MTDEEIVSGLGCYASNNGCCSCSFKKHATCFVVQVKAIFDLINRQKAEIERLKIENQSLRGAANSYKLHYNEARAEGYIDGIKGFVNTLNEDIRKKYSEFHSFYPLFDDYNIFFTKLHIDKRAEEMIRGDTK